MCVCVCQCVCVSVAGAAASLIHGRWRRLGRYKTISVVDKTGQVKGRIIIDVAMNSQTCLWVNFSGWRAAASTVPPRAHYWQNSEAFSACPNPALSNQPRHGDGLFGFCIRVGARGQTIHPPPPPGFFSFPPVPASWFFTRFERMQLLLRSSEPGRASLWPLGRQMRRTTLTAAAATTTRLTAATSSTK